MSDCPLGAFGDEEVGAGAPGLPAPAGQPREQVVTPGVTSQREAAFPEVPVPPPPGAPGNTAERCSREGSSSLRTQRQGRWPILSQVTDGRLTDGGPERGGLAGSEGEEAV